MRFYLRDSFGRVVYRVVADRLSDTAIVTYYGNGRSGYATVRHEQDRE